MEVLHAYSMTSAGCMVHFRHIACFFHAFCWRLPNAWQMHGRYMDPFQAYCKHFSCILLMLTNAWRRHGGRMGDAWRTYRSMPGERMADHLNYVIFEPKSIALGIPSRFITWQNYAFYNVTELHISLVSKWQSLVTARNMATGTGKVRQGNGLTLIEKIIWGSSKKFPIFIKLFRIFFLYQ